MFKFLNDFFQSIYNFLFGLKTKSPTTPSKEEEETATIENMTEILSPRATRGAEEEAGIFSQRAPIAAAAIYSSLDETSTIVESPNKTDSIESFEAALEKMKKAIKKLQGKNTDQKALLRFLNKNECKKLGTSTENYYTDKGLRSDKPDGSGGKLQRTKQLIWDYENKRLYLLLSNKSKQDYGGFNKASTRKGFVVEFSDKEPTFSEKNFIMKYTLKATEAEKETAIVAFNNGKILVPDYGRETTDLEFVASGVYQQTLPQLLALHDNNLIQFDVKPVNMCIDSQGYRTIIDIDKIKENETQFNWLLSRDPYLKKFFINPDDGIKIGPNIQKLLSLYSFLAMHSGRKQLAEKYKSIGSKHEFNDLYGTGVLANIYESIGIKPEFNDWIRTRYRKDGREYKFDDWLKRIIKQDKNIPASRIQQEDRMQLALKIREYIKSQDELYDFEKEFSKKYQEFRESALKVAKIENQEEAIQSATSHLGLRNKTFHADPPRVQGKWESKAFKEVLEIHRRGKICMKFKPDGMPYEQEFGKKSASDADTFNIRPLHKQPYIKRDWIIRQYDKMSYSEAKFLDHKMSYSEAKLSDLKSFYRLIANKGSEVVLDGTIAQNIVTMTDLIKRKIEQIEAANNSLPKRQRPSHLSKKIEERKANNRKQ